MLNMYKYSPEPHESELRNNRNSQAILEGLGNNTFNFLIEVELIYNVVLISAVQRRWFSYTYIYMYIYTFLKEMFFSIMIYHRILNIVPCAIVGPCCLSILYIIVGICQPHSHSIPSPLVTSLENTCKMYLKLPEKDFKNINKICSNNLY